MLAQTNHTPVSFWLSLPLGELVRWIHASNELVREREKDRPQT
ncbi:hypothetical protein [uncultured Flavonifractor sp.]|nr:hypothetical protein [uncultured Flavonifractor sp.]